MNTIIMASTSSEVIRQGPAMLPFFLHQYAPTMPGISPQRFRIPMQQPPFHFNPAGIFPTLHPSIMPPQPLPPQPAPPPTMTSMPTPQPTLTPMSPISNLALTFTQEELDMVLYGYSKGRTSDRYHGHALSGLKFGDLSHDKITKEDKIRTYACERHPRLAGDRSRTRNSGIDRILSDQTSPSESHSDGAGSICSGDSGCSSKNSPVRCPDISNNSEGNLSNSNLSGVFLQQQSFHEHLSPTGSQADVNLGSKSSSSFHTNNNNINKPNGITVNRLPLDPVALGLHDGLAIYQTVFAGTTHTGVFCTKTVIARGTRYGPFKGRVINTSEVKTMDDNTCMWEIFQEGKLSHFIDGQSGSGNWMAYINCARYAQEQNLIAIQVEGEIWYETCKDIPQGTELLVWYGDCYLQFMGVPVALKEMADGGAQDEADSSEGFQCDRCGKVFAYKYYRDKHLKYTRCVDQGDRKYPCHLCNRSFEKRDRLRIHILHVHEKHRPHKCLVCSKSFSQSSSLNKHMRVHSGERPYKCVYCNKAFTASSILRTHIRQHSGEKPFKCKHCGKAFASHAAHDSHVRRTHAKDRPCTCTICGKNFQQAYELKFHMGSHITR